MKALFLDIDGVLQPCGRQERFRHRDEIPSICTELNKTIETILTTKPTLPIHTQIRVTSALYISIGTSPP